MIILIKLILAHLIGDFLLQPKKFLDQKETKKAASPFLYVHAFIHSLLVLLLLWDISLWQLALIIGLTHLLIDTAKLYLQTKKNTIKWFIADQALHIAVLIILWILWFSPEIDAERFLSSENFWAILTAVVFLTMPAGIIIKNLLNPFASKLPGNNDESLINAGKYIGYLERILVFVFILSGHWEAVGFLIAAKSVFRFGDLKESHERKLTEYILIGTLLSFGTAIMIAVMVEKILVQQ